VPGKKKIDGFKCQGRKNGFVEAPEEKIYPTICEAQSAG